MDIGAFGNQQTVRNTEAAVPRSQMQRGIPVVLGGIHIRTGGNERASTAICSVADPGAGRVQGLVFGVVFRPRVDIGMVL